MYIFWFPTRTNTNQPRSQKQDRSLKFKLKGICTIHVAKTKSLISCAVTAQLICVFVFALAFCWFFGAEAHEKCLLDMYIADCDVYRCNISEAVGD